MLAVFLTLLTASEIAAFGNDFIAEFLSRPVPDFVKKLKGQDLADYVNAVQPFFKANYSKISEERGNQVMKLNTPVPRGEILTANAAMDIPESFDAREKWPYCKSIGLIHDQSACGSCWAVSGAAVMSDRLCIRSGGKKQLVLSDTDLLSCCKQCNAGDGCNGAWPYFAWKYIMKDGICTGGLAEDQKVCKPYPFLPCKLQPCPKEGYRAPQCKKECQSTYKINYRADKSYAESAYYLIIGDVKAIQTEIMTNGPVQAVFQVFDDFLLYSSGIYVPTVGSKQRGLHAVKIIGWGVENDVPYWLVANSYNVDFGEEGFFRIIRGRNAAQIEQYVNAGIMKV